jgi:hypothetical protein
MGYILGEPTVQQYFDANGDPLENGTIEFFIYNTSTPTPIYSNSTGTSAGTSVTLNSIGAPENGGTSIALFFDESVVYKIVRKDSAGSAIAPTIGPYYPNGGSPLAIDAVASTATDSLYDYTGTSNGDQASVAGYYVPGDGGGGMFYWNSTSTAADDAGVTILPTGHVGAGRWKRIYSGAVNVKWFGAKGDNVTNDTVPIQAAVDSILSTGGIVTFPDGTYLMGQVTITDSDGVTLDGTGAVLTLTGTDGGFDSSGVLSNLTIKGFNCVGDGTSTNDQNLYKSTAASSITNIKILNNTISNIQVGISVSSENGGSCEYIEIAHNYISALKGILGGTGYGIQVAGANNVSIYANIHHNTIVDAGRHAIYVARGDNVLVTNNIIKDHKLTEHSGLLRAAIASFRGSRRQISNNIIRDSYGGAIHVNGNDAVAITRDVQVINNIVTNNLEALPLVTVGATSPAVDGDLYDILISGNILRTGTVSGAAVEIYSGNDVTIENNLMFMEVATGQAIIFDAFGETSGTATYSDNWIVRNNIIDLIGASSYAFRTVATFAASIINLTLNNNKVVENGAGVWSIGGAALTTVVINIKDTPQLGINWTSPYNGIEEVVDSFLDGDGTPPVIGGHIFKTANTSGRTITDFDGGNEGQRITVIINDVNTTIDFTGSNLKGNAGVDWTPTTGDSMTCVYDGALWYCDVSDNTA